jgi:N-glycosylase/DNA lyase
MKNLMKCVQHIKGIKVHDVVEKRLREFKRVGRGSSREIFKELCFCILTANYTAEGGIRIQKEIGDGFLMLSEKQLAKRLRELKHRFPNMRAKYIVEARRHSDSLRDIIKSHKDEKELRAWIVKHVKGVGYKEASHFMRNIGFLNVAIIDFHIVDFLASYGLMEEPKTLTPRKYIEIEELLARIAELSGMNLAELDLYMWYCETGKVLK